MNPFVVHLVVIDTTCNIKGSLLKYNFLFLFSAVAREAGGDVPEVDRGFFQGRATSQSHDGEERLAGRRADQQGEDAGRHQPLQQRATQASRSVTSAATVQRLNRDFVAS